MLVVSPHLKIRFNCSTSKHYRCHINKISQAEEVAHEIYDLCVPGSLSSPPPSMHMQESGD